MISLSEYFKINIFAKHVQKLWMHEWIIMMIKIGVHSTVYR